MHAGNATKAGEKDVVKSNQVFNEWMASSDGRRKLQSNTTSITVPVYVHVITASNGLLGNVTESTIAEQMTALNVSFRPHFAFVLVKTNYVDNDDWYSGALSLDEPRTAMMRELRQGGSGTLNIYIVDSTPDVETGSTLLGLAGFPFEYTTTYVFLSRRFRLLSSRTLSSSVQRSALTILLTHRAQSIRGWSNDLAWNVAGRHLW